MNPKTKNVTTNTQNHVLYLSLFVSNNHSNSSSVTDKLKK